MAQVRAVMSGTPNDFGRDVSALVNVHIAWLPGSRHDAPSNDVARTRSTMLSRPFPEYADVDAPHWSLSSLVLLSDAKGRLYRALVVRPDLKTTIVVHASGDGGATWPLQRDVITTSGIARFLRAVFAPNGDLLLSYVDSGGSSDGDPGNRFRTGSGTADPPVPVADGVSIVPQPAPLVVTDRGPAIAFTIGNRKTGTRIDFARSTDGGATWIREAPIDDDDCAGTLHLHPELRATSDGALHALWLDDRFGLDLGARRGAVWYARSTDGRTFGPSQRVSEEPIPFADTCRESGLGFEVSPPRVIAAWARNDDKCRSMIESARAAR